MSVRRLPGAQPRWRAEVKSGRIYVASRVFDTEKAAKSWEGRTKASIVGGVDPRSGKRRVDTLIDDWLEERKSAGLSAKTLAADKTMADLVSPALGRMQVGAVSPQHIQQWMRYLEGERGQAQSSIARHRGALSGFFTWCVEGHLIESNPVTSAKLTRGSAPAAEIDPFTEQELAEVLTECRAKSTFWASVVLVLARTGLRWGELRGIRVRDWRRYPHPCMAVTRSRSELPAAVPRDRQTKAPKSGRTRLVPVIDEIVPILNGWAAGKRPTDLLVTTPQGGTLWRSSLSRTLDWPAIGRGRSIHALRHTAATWWLASGVPLPSVSAWLGHADVSITARVYAHYLGDSAALAGLDLLNRSVAKNVRGASGAHGGKKKKAKKRKKPPAD